VLAVNKWYPINPSLPEGVLAIAAAPRKDSYLPEVRDQALLYSGWTEAAVEDLSSTPVGAVAKPDKAVTEIDPLYLFACHIEWERQEDTGGAWELIAAAQSSQSDIRAHARALLTASRHLGGSGLGTANENTPRQKRQSTEEENMKLPHGLEVDEKFTSYSYVNQGFFRGLSEPVLRALDQASHKSTVPAGAILFVEGQSPRGMFILCSGRVKLSTTSREGKILVLKTAEAGEALGLSAAISGMGFEMTAETATTCQMNFIDRRSLLNLLQNHSEIGLHAAQSLSRDFRAAYRDIHDLVLTRSSAGKLARLLLSHSPDPDVAENFDSQPHSPMTHEEMAQRIGSSRETVTRLLSDLKRKRLIGLDGPKLVIHDRMALEALAV
jgi:CRP/FNR family cyclic AMP-dependent transcriptional regulator